LAAAQGATVDEQARFADFIRRIRAGDDEAARELLARYEPIVRREVRVRVRDPRLYTQFDWTDICQSVMASFFLRAASGQYQLDDPGQLLRLLLAMTRHKVAHQVRKHSALRRDHRRLEARDPAFLEGRATERASPSRLVAGRELWDEYRRRLSDQERALADLRAEGCEWEEIAARLGGTAQARRKQLARAVARVEEELAAMGEEARGPERRGE
jgi:RNA polymerase sigma-70 factor (ECF subfamily)